MREMKESGVEWIGEIPVDWDVKKFKYFFDIIGGAGFKEEYQGNTSGDYPFCKASDINGQGKIISTAKNYVDEDLVKNERYSVIPENSILISKIGEALKKNHRKINKIQCIVDNNCEAFVMNTENDIVYLYYVLSLVDMCWFDNGGTIPSVNNEKLKNSFLPSNTFLEQRHIADYLDEKCAKIDSIIEKQREVIGKLKAYKLSVITEAVTKGLNPDVPMKDSGIEWIGEIPEHWSVLRFKNIGYCRNGLTYSPADLCDESDGILVLRSSNIQNGKLAFEDNVYVNCKVRSDVIVKTGDILICSRNGSAKLIGKNTLIPDGINAAFGAFMMIFRCESPFFMQYVLNSNIFMFYLSTFSTSTINQLTANNFMNIKFCYPCDTFEQKEIANYLDNKCSEIESTITKKQAIIDKLTEYKKSLIYEVVTGKKEV